MTSLARILAAAEPTSAPVTQWPLRALLVLIVLGVIALVLLGMRRGWRRRAHSQGDYPEPPMPASWPEDASATACVPGVFLGTTTHGDWLDRIVVHDLGVRSRAMIAVSPVGVTLLREGALDLLIPAASLHGAGLARGIAGKAYERDGVLVITWDLGGRLIDTGLRADAAEDQRILLDAILGLVAEQGRAGEVSR